MTTTYRDPSVQRGDALYLLLLNPQPSWAPRNSTVFKVVAKSDDSSSFTSDPLRSSVWHNVSLDLYDSRLYNLTGEPGESGEIDADGNTIVVFEGKPPRSFKRYIAGNAKSTFDGPIPLAPDESIADVIDMLRAMETIFKKQQVRTIPDEHFQFFTHQPREQKASSQPKGRARTTRLNPAIRDTTMCEDIYMMDEFAIQKYLKEKPDNFVIGIEISPGSYKWECQSLDYLKQQWRLPGNPTDREPYNNFYECPRDDEREVRVFVKMSSSLLLVEKPAWLWDGPVPEPRVFLLEKSGTVQFFVNSMFVPTPMYELGNIAVSTDHCNQTGPSTVYRLVPFVATSSFLRDSADKFFNMFRKTPLRRYLSGGVIMSLMDK